MMFRWPPVVLALLLIMSFSSLFGAAPARAEFDIRKVDPSVIRIQHIIRRGNKAGFGPHGSGFVINEDGYAVTNQHVVRLPRLPSGVRHVALIVPDGSWKRDKLRRVRIVWESKALDLAIIKVEGLRRPPVPISTSRYTESPRKGEKVFAVGFPGAADASLQGALSTTLTSGIVGKVFVGSGGREQTNRPIIQHEAGVSPGNSGGPLFNDCNQVVGVNTFVATSKFVVRREGGKIVARGAAVSGVYYSPHVASLVTELKARNIKFNAASGFCLAGKPSSAPSNMMFVYIAVAVALAGAAVLLALRRPRERVVQVVESYSQALRRSGGRAPQAPTAVGRYDNVEPTAQGQGDATPHPVAAPVPAAHQEPIAAGDGWSLSGFDSQGHAVRLGVAQSLLARSGEGVVIGRQASLSDVELPDPTVSRRHARLVPVGGGIGIVDLNSSNGTTVDGRLLSPYGDPLPLQVGATVEFGDVKLKLHRD